jgi:hypothetical protein
VVDDTARRRRPHARRRRLAPSETRVVVSRVVDDGFIV